jgi:hypothetical protein
MRTQIPAATMAAAMAAVVAALTPPQGVAAEAIETRVFSSAAPRGVLREIAPVFERVTGQRLVIEYAFATADASGSANSRLSADAEDRGRRSDGFHAKPFETRRLRSQLRPRDPEPAASQQALGKLLKHQSVALGGKMEIAENEKALVPIVTRLLHCIEGRK